MAGAAEDYRPGRMLGLMARSLVLPTAAPAGAGVAAEPAGGISVTYVGHATVLVRFDGVALLTDPVYSQRLILPKRLVEPGVPLAQLPPLDVVLVSHGHMDHLDVPTHRRLPKTDTVAVVAKNLSDLVAGCGYREVIELAWGDTVTIRGLRVTALPVKHWGTRNLWPDDRGYTGFLVDDLAGAATSVAVAITPRGRVSGNTPLGSAADAVQLALADAGLERTDLDGLLLNPGLAWADMGMGSFQLQQAMGLRDLRLSATMHLGGATACAMIQHAAQAIAASLCTTVACVFSDVPLKPPKPEGERGSSGSAYGFVRGWEAAYGYFGVNAMYALVARRHMHRYGTTQDHLGAVAVAQRRWANL